jgi:hypothetical protein
LNGASLAGYVIFYKETGLKFEQNLQLKVPAGVTFAEINGLKKFSSYTVRVLAYTEKGNGIASEPVVVSTDEDSKSPYILYSIRIITNRYNLLSLKKKRQIRVDQSNLHCDF